MFLLYLQTTEDGRVKIIDTPSQACLVAWHRAVDVVNTANHFTIRIINEIKNVAIEAP